jgi:hypothetical protein
MKLNNAFTAGMLDLPATVRFEPIAEVTAQEIAAKGLESCVGHQGSADLFSAKLGVPVLLNRVSVKLAPGERILLGQYQGPRLPEGRVLSADELAAAGIQWVLVTVSKD